MRMTVAEFAHRPACGDGFWYLGSPYAKYAGGKEEAARVVSRVAGGLILGKVPIFCPISHSHAIAEAARIDPDSHDIWLPADQPLIRAAYGLMVCTMEGWRESKGLQFELGQFFDRRRPIYYIDPETLIVSTYP
jgi:hypothetical protein